MVDIYKLIICTKILAFIWKVVDLCWKVCKVSKKGVTH